MDRHLEIALITLVLMVCLVRMVAASSLEIPFKEIPKVELSFGIGEAEPEWQLSSQSKNEAAYTWEGYKLSLRLEKMATQQAVRMTLEPPAGKQLSIDSYSAKVSAPVDGMHAVMVPNTRILAHTLIYYHENRKWPENPSLIRCLIPDSFREDCYANSEAPYALITDNKGNNKLSVGWGGAEVASLVTGGAEGEHYAVTLSRSNDVPFTGRKWEDTLLISTVSRPWMDIETDYAKAFDKLNGRSRSAAPGWAGDPVFCTWYCYLDDIDQEGVLKIAKKCADLGFGTILIDAGWDAHPKGGYGDFENGILGDFVAMPDRFPDLAGAVKQMHDMGLRVQLWAAPFWQGKKSKTYQERSKDWHVRDEDGAENHHLCPKHPKTRELFYEQFAELTRRYNIDGMWLDAADGVPQKCFAEHDHLEQSMGEAFVDTLAAARNGLRSVKPDAVTEVRVLHGNLNSKRAFDLVQPSDAPESYEMLRLAGIHIRPWAYDIMLKNDPYMWPKNADAATVGKYLATMVCNGVPALSVDFLTASEEQCNLTKAWLAFYQQHRKTLLNGKFSVFGEDYTRPDMMLVRGSEAVVYIRNPKTLEVDLPRSVTRVILLNCTDQDRMSLKLGISGGVYEAQSYKPDWRKTGLSATLEGAGTVAFSHVVPQGGAAIISKR